MRRAKRAAGLRKNSARQGNILSRMLFIPVRRAIERFSPHGSLAPRGSPPRTARRNFFLTMRRLPYFAASGCFGDPGAAGGSDDIDRSNVDALPQFRHSAAGLPLAPESSRKASAPQCGQTNFMIALSQCRELPAQAGGAVVTTEGSLLARSLCPAALLPPRSRRAARSDC